jgi:hypothetical protein
MSPRDLILAYLGEVPITIREWLQAMCLIVFDALPMDPDMRSEDYMPLIEGLLSADAPFEAYKVAMMAAVIETALVERNIDEEEFYRGLAERTGSPFFAKMSVQAPLKERHLAAARTQFAELRAGPLSPTALRLWSDTSMAKRWSGE